MDGRNRYADFIQRGIPMNARNDIDSRIRRFCMVSCTNEKEMEDLGKSLLTIFRDVCRSNTGDAEEIIADLCSDSEEDDEFRRMNESLVRLEFFATEGERCRYERSIHSVLETGWMLHVMEALKMKVYNFPDYGPEFVSILTLCYMNSFRYSEQEILDELGMSKANYYRHKKRAIIVFGLAFLSYRQNYVKPDPYTFGISGEQLTFDFAPCI